MKQNINKPFLVNLCVYENRVQNVKSFSLPIYKNKYTYTHYK